MPPRALLRLHSLLRFLPNSEIMSSSGLASSPCLPFSVLGSTTILDSNGSKENRAQAALAQKNQPPLTSSPKVQQTQPHRPVSSDPVSVRPKRQPVLIRDVPHNCKD